MELTDGVGVDVVYEHVGGDLFQKGLDSLAKDGRLVTCGAHAGEVVPFDIIPFFRTQKRIIGSFVYTRQEVEKCFDLLARGLIEPLVHSTFPLERVPPRRWMPWRAESTSGRSCSRPETKERKGHETCGCRRRGHVHRPDLRR